MKLYVGVLWNEGIPALFTVVHEQFLGTDTVTYENVHNETSSYGFLYLHPGAFVSTPIPLEQYLISRL